LIAEIYKNGIWNKLVWIQGDDPLVVIEVEQDVLFNFVSSYATLTIFDKDGIYRPGGGSEIVRGDVVRIKGGGSNVEIFRGFVDREQSWNYENERLSFRVLDYSQELKDLKVGKRGRVINEEGGIENVSAVRWIRDVTERNEDDIDEHWIQIIWEHIYPTLTPAEQIGAKEVYLYNSRGIGFRLENNQPAFYEKVKWGVYRWREKNSLMLHLEFSDIAQNILDQLNLEYGSYKQLIFEPGSIERDARLKVIDKVFDDGDLFSKQISDELRPCYIGWDIERNEAEVYIFSNISNCGSPIKLNWDFGLGEVGNERTSGWMRSKLNQILDDGRNNDDYWIHNDNVTCYRRQQVIDDENIILVYQLWSWIEEHQTTPRSPVIDYGKCAVAEWFAIDLTTGNILNHAWHSLVQPYFDFRYALSDPPVMPTWKLLTLPDYDYPGQPTGLPGRGTWSPGSDEVVTTLNLTGYLTAGDIVYPSPISGGEGIYEVASVTSTKIFLTAGYNGDTVLSAQVYKDLEIYNYASMLWRQNNYRLEWLNGQYVVITGVVHYSGLLEFSAMSYDFRDKSAGQVLREICLLTNSILYVKCASDGTKQVYIVSREYVGNSVTLKRRDLIGMPALTVMDRKGDDPPQVDSQVIDNDDFDEALSNFYADSYYLEKQDVVSIVCDPDVDAHWNIELFDKITISGVKIKDKIVRKILYGKDYIQLELMSVHDENLYPNPFN